MKTIEKIHSELIEDLTDLSSELDFAHTRCGEELEFYKNNHALVLGIYIEKLVVFEDKVDNIIHEFKVNLKHLKQ